MYTDNWQPLQDDEEETRIVASTLKMYANLDEGNKNIILNMFLKILLYFTIWATILLLSCFLTLANNTIQMT